LLSFFLFRELKATSRSDMERVTAGAGGEQLNNE